MLNALRHFFFYLFSKKKNKVDDPSRSAVNVVEVVVLHEPRKSLEKERKFISELHDVDIDKMRLLWAVGDWTQFENITEEKIKSHCERLILALFAAAGRINVQDYEKAREYLALAINWGATINLVSEFLVSGVQINIAKSSHAAGRKTQAKFYIERNTALGIIDKDINYEFENYMFDKLGIYKIASEKSIKKKDEKTACKPSENTEKHHLSLEAVQQYWRESKEDPLRYVYADRFRSERLVQLISDYVPLDGRVLEIGTNAGRNLYCLYESGFKDLWGIEISEKAINFMKKYYPELNSVPIFNGPVEECIESYSDRFFDCAFTMAVFEHVHHESYWIFSHVARIAKVVITVEDELRNGPRHFARNYEQVFTQYGMRQLHLEGREKFNLPTGFSARVFVHAD